MSSPLLRYFLAAVALMLAMSVDGRAQICGDGDNSGAVTVTDGVQTLRAAAGLASSCTNATCDVDGSGGVTVTDGVNVLRKAAGLPITENCGGGGVNAQIQELLQNTVPIFGGLTKIGSGAAGAQAAGSSNICDNAEGSVTFDPELNVIVFDNCTLEGVGYDGTLGIDESGSVLSFDISFFDYATEEFFSIGGDLSFRNENNVDIIDGRLQVQFSSLGDIDVQFEDVATDSEGNFVDGALLFNAADSGIEGVVGIRVGFTSTVLSPVTVFLSDDTELDFNFNIVTGELTPVSN